MKSSIATSSSSLLSTLIVVVAIVISTSTASATNSASASHNNNHLSLRRRGLIVVDDISNATESSELELELESESLLGLEQQQLEREPRIIGGSVVNDRSRYSYFALMNGNALCGAVLIGSKFVLTAAHCAYADTDFEIGTVSRNNNNGVDWGSLFGGSGSEGSGIEYDYIAGRIHPNYNEDDVSNDIAIFELKQAVPSSVATPIKLRQQPLTPSDSGTIVTVIGFGDTDKSDSVSATSQYLREVDLNYVTADQCDNAYGGGNSWFYGGNSYIEDGMMCAYRSSVDSCGGDSGGPLLLKGNSGGLSSTGSSSSDELVGLVSWGISCADDDFPGVYTRISYYYDWIVATMCELNSDPSGLPDGVVCHGSSSSGGGGGSSSGSGSSNSGAGTSRVPAPAPAPAPVPAPVPTIPDNDDTAASSWFQEAYEYVTNYFGWD